MGRKNYKRGLTFIEIVVVIAILGILIILASLSIKPRFQLAKARDAKRKADLKKIATVLEDYNNDEGCYPKVLGNELPPYLSLVPHDPKTNRLYDYVCPDPDCGKDNIGCSKFAIFTTLEAETGTDYGQGNYVVTSPNYRVEGIAPTASPTQPEGVPTVPTNAFGCKHGFCVPIYEPCQPIFLGYPDCDSGNGFPCGTPNNPRNECIVPPTSIP